MQGLFAIYRKELSDHFSSNRFVILFALIAMVSFITSYMAGINLRENLEGGSPHSHQQQGALRRQLQLGRCSLIMPRCDQTRKIAEKI